MYEFSKQNIKDSLEFFRRKLAVKSIQTLYKTLQCYNVL